MSESRISRKEIRDSFYLPDGLFADHMPERERPAAGHNHGPRQGFKNSEMAPVYKLPKLLAL